MKKLFFVVLFLIEFCGFSQQKFSKKIISSSKSVNVYLSDIDQITIENSLKPNVFEIELTERDAKFYTIEINENKIVKISVKSEQPKGFINQRNTFCVEFPNYANCVLRIPKEKNLILFGENVDVISTNFDGNSSIYINKGGVKIKNPKGNTAIKLFAGTVYATLFNSLISVQTNKGTITFDDKKRVSPFVNKIKKTIRKFSVNSINSNVIINSKFKTF